MSSTHGLSKSTEALSAFLLNPRVSKEAKDSTLNRMDGIRPRNEPSAGASSSRARSRSREKSSSDDEGARKLRKLLHRFAAMFVGEKPPEMRPSMRQSGSVDVPRVRERGLPSHHVREDPQNAQERSREGHVLQKPRQIPVPGQVQERHPRHRERHTHETWPHREHRHDGRSRPRHEHEHEHRHRHRENHVHFVDEERPARIVAQQKALVLDPNASSRVRRRAADFLEFHGESVL